MGSRRGVFERVSGGPHSWRASHRMHLSEVSRNTLSETLSFSSQSRGSCCPKSCCPLNLLHLFSISCPKNVSPALSQHFSPRNKFRGSEKGWREGVGDQQHSKPAKHSSPELRPPSPTEGIGKRVQKRSLHLWHSKDLLRPTPLCLPTPFDKHLLTSAC